MSEPRKHHHTSAFYLAGFSNGGRQDGSLEVLDRTNGKAFRATARTVGYERDLFRLDIPNVDPNTIEKAYAKLEGNLAPALHRLVDDEHPADPTDIAKVLNIVAMLSTRSPGYRSAVETLMVDRAKTALDDPDAYERFLESRREQGLDVSEYGTLDELRERTRDMRVVANPAFITIGAFKTSADVYDSLAERYWTVYSCDRMASGPIVTSDRPVSILPGSPEAVGRPLSYESKESVVQFPIDRHHVLIGRWHGPHAVRGVLEPARVALTNAFTTAGAHRHIYSPSRRFYAEDMTSARRVTGDQLLGDLIRSEQPESDAD